MKKGVLVLAYAVFFTLAACSSDEPATIIEDPPEAPDYSSCATAVNEAIFEMMTWNLEEFPIKGETTMERLKQVILQQQPDVVAVQEITSPAALSDLVEELDNYEAQIHNFGYLRLGFLYKTSEVTVKQDLQVILDDDPYAFPRAPIMMTFEHMSGMTTVLINIHLKCCGGSENVDRRSEASRQLKAYIDTNLSDTQVVLLGDFNGWIAGVPDNEHSFLNFINDSINYAFADMHIARGDQEFWSYPDWPSHIDHILITNELFDQVLETATITLDQCDDAYFQSLSDHRPVMIKLAQ